LSNSPASDRGADAQLEEWTAGVLRGEPGALARVISLVERGDSGGRTALAALYSRTGRAHVVGVTGAPGTGKSTLVAEMVHAYRRQGRSVAVVAVDPTSPFSGGALLGDRVRMTGLAHDPQVFVRSMATRGNLGGLAQATADVVSVLDAGGFDMVIVETVGAGQSEVEIARLADTTLVLQMPASGDDIQAIKAGILEIADVLVVNKSDLPGADKMVELLQSMQSLGHASQERHHGQSQAVKAAVTTESVDRWVPPVLKASALTGQGIDQLLAAIESHREFLGRTGAALQRTRARATEGLERELCHQLLRRLRSRVPDSVWKEAIEAIAAREQDVYTAAERVAKAAEETRP